MPTEAVGFTKTQQKGQEYALDEVSTYSKYAEGKWQTLPADLPQEQTMTVFINGQELVSILCTPEKLSAMVIGFLFAEGLVTNLKEITTMRVCLEDSTADVRLTKQVEMPARRTITSGCGGGTSFDLGDKLRPLDSSWSVTPAQISSSMKLLQNTSGNGRTKGMHVSALTDGKNLIARAEDIGRHNTLDKIWGECLLTEIPTADRLLVTTGRISSEMLLKVARMGVPVVASLNSATQRAVQIGIQTGITIVGYARGQQFSVYSHPERIAGFPADALTGTKTG